MLTSIWEAQSHPDIKSLMNSDSFIIPYWLNKYARFFIQIKFGNWILDSDFKWFCGFTYLGPLGIGNQKQVKGTCMYLLKPGRYLVINAWKSSVLFNTNPLLSIDVFVEFRKKNVSMYSKIKNSLASEKNKIVQRI